jgi:hypothetical protein
MRFEELCARRQRQELTMAETAEMLGVSERRFRRWSDRYEIDGVEGLQDRRLGQGSAGAMPRPSSDTSRRSCRSPSPWNWPSPDVELHGTLHDPAPPNPL